MYINCTATFCQHKFLCTLLFCHCRQRKQNPANTLYFQHTYKSIFYKIIENIQHLFYFIYSFIFLIDLFSDWLNCEERAHGSLTRNRTEVGTWMG